MKYNVSISFEGKAHESVEDCENNEEVKRKTKELMKEYGIPKGKYAIVSIVRDEDKKVILDDLWTLN